MVRGTSDLSALEGISAALVHADVTEPSTLPAALEGVSVVFHVAGLTKSRDPEAYFRVNEEGSRALMQACRDHQGLRRFVYISSQAACGPSRPNRPRTEEDLPTPIGPYGASKLAGEEACRDAGGEQVPLTIVRPAIVYGPWERDMLRLFQLARRGLAPRVRGDSCVSMIHATDLSDLIERAGRLDVAAGNTYFGADPSPYWMRDILQLIGKICGRRVVQLPIAPALLWPFALLNEQFQKMGAGIEILTLTRLKEFRERFWMVDPTRARDELGWESGTGIEEGLRETARWYVDSGWLTPPAGTSESAGERD
jgi:nucleoside-diphosphate-sugar epimerase